MASPENPPLGQWVNYIKHSTTANSQWPFEAKPRDPQKADTLYLSPDAFTSVTGLGVLEFSGPVHSERVPSS
jgi:hypothetical protein